MNKRSFISAAGRFQIEVSHYDDGNLYRARGPYGMVGIWQESEEMCGNDFLSMVQGIKLSDAENDWATGIYERVHDL